MLKGLITLIIATLIQGCACGGVIGVYYDRNNVVTNVVKDGPADKAGIRYGDILIDPPYSGIEGTHATVIVNRNGQQLVFLIKRENACKMQEWN